MLIAVICTLLTLVESDNDVVLYRGTTAYPLTTLDHPGLPFVSVSDFCRALGYAQERTDQGLRVTVFNRLIIFETESQRVDLGWKKLTVQMRSVDSVLFVRVDHLIQTFSEVIGKDLIYEPTSKSVHLPDDKRLNIALRTRWTEGFMRVSFLFSKRIEAPNLYRSGQFLILSVKAPTITVDKTYFELNEAIEDISVFTNLPDSTSEIHLKLGPTVRNTQAEPFASTQSELVVKISGTFTAAVDPVAAFHDASAQESPGIHRIVIDPGHGGKDLGARGPSGLEEKMVTLDLARKLKRHLEATGKYEVMLTRNEDFALPLKVRTGVANNFNADLFLSVHMNAIVRPDAWGSETYYLSLDEQDDFAENYTVTFENQEDEDTAGEDSEFGSELDLLLWDLAQSEHVDDSFRVARYIQEELNILAGVRSRGVKQAPLKVLKGAVMPAVLIEVAFISNPSEEKKLRDYEFKAKVVRAISRAIDRYDRDVQRRSASQTAEMQEETP
ncbi:MAG: N-acetylmuramoyl-L-alanine amidase [Acidobacteria bacterium]|nr:N-acetylmuramoyl-L-alanine amidase [Acidobacteriota bacterium]